MKKKALVLGATGQDGSYLCELLLEKGYETHGLMRRSSSFNTARLDHIFNQLQMHYGDLTDGSGLDALLVKFKYDEIYSLAAQSHVKVSFDIPEYTCQVGAMGTLKLLEAVRAHCPDARVYNASSSEMFGSTPPPQSESTVFHPRSPYGCAKVFAHNLCVNYREAYGMHVSNGILFNHESPRRGETFVTHKITKAAARISVGLQKELALGNLDAKRDWGHAQDYVEAMWLMMQQPKADDYVIATGKTHTIRELLDVAFGALDLDWKKYVTVDPKYFRATEVDILQGDATKARTVLGWKPRWSFKCLIEDMVAADRAEAFAERGISLIDQQ